ncbi:MAG TPA: DMT family transporter [Nitrososphaerales archaeon]|nr:DMT family transporter [Nitrososphaerales archaeon]
MYLSIAAGLTTAFCWGTADYLSRYQSEKVGYYKTVVYSNVVTLVVLFALVPILSPNLELATFPILVLVGAGILNFIAFNFLYRAFQKGVVSVVAPVAYTFPAVTTVLSVVILGIFLSYTRILAIAGIIVGVILLSTRFSELGTYLRGKGAPNVTAGLESAIGASVFFGSVYIGIGYAAPFVSVVVPAMVLRSVAIIAGFLLAPLLHQRVRPSRIDFSRIILVMGVLEATGFLSFTYGISAVGGSLPVVAALSGMGGAVASAYGLVLLKERLEPNQMAGVVLSLVGVFTLLYLGG